MIVNGVAYDRGQKLSEYSTSRQWTYGYPTAITLMAVIELCLVYRFRKAGWM